MAIEETGTKIRFISTRRPAADKCPHSFRAEATARTHYLFPPSFRATAEFLARPSNVARGLRYIANLSDTPYLERAKLVALLPVAMELARTCRTERIEHIHIHSCASAAHLGALARRMGAPPYSLTLHGDLPVYGTGHSAKMEPAAFVSAVTKPLEKQICAVAPFARRPVIPMGVDCEFFQPPKSGRSRTPGDRLEVITVARLNHTKGHRFALEAIARLVAGGMDIGYRIIGSGPAEAAIRENVAKLNLTDRVEFTGSLDQHTVRDALAQAHVLTLTSFGYGEAAPVTVMEAMASGLPVIVSDIGGTPDMIVSGVNGYLTPQQDVDAIAEALRRLANDSAHAAEVGRAARAQALKAFDFRLNAAKLLAEINSSRNS